MRGPVRFWRVLITLNPGNSLLYWLVGRRRAATVAQAMTSPPLGDSH